MILISIWESTTPLCMDYNNVSVHYKLLSYTIFSFLKLTIIDFILDLVIILTVSFFEILTFHKKKSASEILTLPKKVLLKFS